MIRIVSAGSAHSGRKSSERLNTERQGPRGTTTARRRSLGVGAIFCFSTTMAKQGIPDLNISELWKGKNVYTTGGQVVEASQLINGATVIALMRHFGCWKQAQSLLQHKPEMDSAGVSLVAIGIGTPDTGAEFCKRSGFLADNLYCDPDKTLYTSLSFRRGWMSTLFTWRSFPALWALFFPNQSSLKDVMQNYDNNMTLPSDVQMTLQQGGVLHVYCDLAQTALLTRSIKVLQGSLVPTSTCRRMATTLSAGPEIFSVVLVEVQPTV
ncbi:hypothetical protein WJX84_000088 [Apatococcus fuscideae]|uniref:Uncharacterized protein n=1 Tax=Apatococcus fuscideae TaxID=2026836 RepID=A0AAW1RK91_9CHLO